MNFEKKILDGPYEKDPLAAGCRLLSYCYADDQESLCYGTQRLYVLPFFSQISPHLQFIIGKDFFLM
jgi:hypothetical protein